MKPSEMLALNRKLAAPQHLRPISRDRIPFSDGFWAYHEPLGEFVRGNQYAHLMDNFKKALKKKGLTVEDLKESLDAAICEGMKRKGRSIKGFCVTPSKMTVEQSEIERYKSDPRGPQGLSRTPRGRAPADWKVLALAALDGKLTQTLLSAVSRQISCGSCRADWMKYLRAHPLQAGSAEAMWQWQLDAHNYVNAKLKKPILTSEQAKAIWQ